MSAGAHGRYRWLVDRRYGIKDLIERCPGAVRDRYVVISSFDSGPLRPSADEEAAGWVFENNLTYLPKVEEAGMLPHDRFDEWYVFRSPVRLGACEVFVRFGAESYIAGGDNFLLATVNAARFAEVTGAFRAGQAVPGSL